MVSNRTRTLATIHFAARYIFTHGTESDRRFAWDKKLTRVDYA